MSRVRGTPQSMSCSAAKINRADLPKHCVTVVTSLSAMIATQLSLTVIVMLQVVHSTRTEIIRIG